VLQDCPAVLRGERTGHVVNPAVFDWIGDWFMLKNDIDSWFLGIDRQLQDGRDR
jgi:hypothetical protein